MLMKKEVNKMDEYQSIFVESNESIGILYKSYGPTMEVLSKFIDSTEKHIDEMNEDPENHDESGIKEEVNKFKKDIDVKYEPAPINVNKIKATIGDVKDLKKKLDSLITKYASLRKKTKYGGSAISAQFYRPKVYSNEINGEKYTKIQSSIRLVNLSLGWIEKCIIDLDNFISQDINILTLVDKVYVKKHIFEGVAVEDVATSVIPMLPPAKTESSTKAWSNTADKKHSTVPGYISNNHDIANYGEDDSAPAETPKEVTLDDYKRPSAEDDKPSEPILPPVEDDKVEDNPFADKKPEVTPQQQQPSVNNYYYYTYNNSLNRHHRDDHSINTKTDDHSTHVVKSNDNREDFHKVESAEPWKLDIVPDVSAIMESSDEFLNKQMKHIREILNKDSEKLGKISQEVADSMSENFKNACFWTDCKYGFDVTNGKEGINAFAVLASLGNYDYEIGERDSSMLMEEMRQDLHKYVAKVNERCTAEFGDRYAVGVMDEEGMTDIDQYIDTMKKMIDQYGARRVSNGIEIHAAVNPEYLKSITPDQNAVETAEFEKYKGIMKFVLKWIEHPAVMDKDDLAFQLFPICKAIGISQEELDQKVSDNIDADKFKTQFIGKYFSDDAFGKENFDDEWGAVIVICGYDAVYLIYSPGQKKVRIVDLSHNEVYTVDNCDFAEYIEEPLASKLKEFYAEVQKDHSLLESVLVEEVGDADDMKPQSDHPVKDVLMDIDRKSTKVQQDVKRNVQNIANVGRAATKPLNRTKMWIGNMVNQWKDKNENDLKEDLADPHSRNALFKAIKTCIEVGALAQAGLLFNPIFGALFTVYKVSNNKNKMRIRNQMIGELKTEMEIIDEKIKDADNNHDNKAKYQLMRLKNELNKKLLRVGGTKTFKKLL